MTKKIELTGDQIARRDHIARQKLGTKGIEHLTNKDTTKRDKRNELISDVSKIGAENRREAELEGAKKRAKKEDDAVKVAEKLADEAKRKADQAQEEVKEFNRVQKLEKSNADKDVQIAALQEQLKTKKAA